MNNYAIPTQNKSIPRLLVVDDDVSILRLIAEVLNQSFGEEILIETASNVEDAIARIDLGNVEILLTDLDMPGATGLDLLKRSKSRKTCAQVILLTGTTDSISLLDALELGANDYLVKPLDLEMLDQLVRESMQRLARWKQALRETWAKKRTNGGTLLQANS